MMFLQGTPPTDSFASGVDFGSISFYDKVLTKINEAFDTKKISGFFMELEDNAKKTNTKIANGLKGTSDTIAKAVFNAYKNTQMIGGSMQDATDYLESYADELGKLPNILEDVVEQSIEFAKASGMATKEIGQSIGKLSQFGIGQKEALDRMQKTFLVARKFGVDSSKLTKTLVENISKANSYGFKDGAAGLTKMAAQSQSLSVNMKDTFNLAGDMLDPDKALEFSTNMQLLGNDAGGLGDFFMNMYQAQNDVEGFQKRIEKSMTSIVSINKQTGEIGRMSGSQMQRAREMANLLGKDFDQIVQESESLTKNQFKLDKIKGGLINKGITSEEDQQLIASLAEIGPGGEVKIQIPGQKAMIDAANVTAQDIEKLRGGLKSGEDVEKMGATDVDKRIEGIAGQQLSTLQNINNSLERIEKSQIFGMGADKGLNIVTESIQPLATSAEKVANNFMGASTATETLIKALKKVDTYVTDQIEAVSIVAVPLANTFATAIDAAADAAISTGVSTPTPNPNPTFDAFLPSGNAPIIGKKDEWFQGIVGDEVLMGTNLKKGLDSVDKQRSLSSELIKNMGMSMDEMMKPLESLVKVSPSLKNIGTASKLNEMSSQTTNINTTNTQKVEGGFTITIDASKVDKSLDPTMIKNEVMNAMYKLKDEMKKQGVLNFDLK